MAGKPNIIVKAVHKRTRRAEHVMSGWIRSEEEGSLVVEGPYNAGGYLHGGPGTTRTGAEIRLLNGEMISTGPDGEWRLDIYFKR